MEFGKRHDTTDTTDFSRSSLLWTCYGDTGVMDFGLSHFRCGRHLISLDHETGGATTSPSRSSFTTAFNHHHLHHHHHHHPYTALHRHPFIAVAAVARRLTSSEHTTSSYRTARHRKPPLQSWATTRYFKFCRFLADRTARSMIGYWQFVMNKVLCVVPNWHNTQNFIHHEMAAEAKYLQRK